MCFDIDVNKYSMEELRDTLGRISMLLTMPTVVNNLPDKGHQLRLAKIKLANEITFRENLEETRKMMKKLSIRCTSEATVTPSHSSKLCSMEKKPERERFKPYLTLKPSGLKTKSMRELHSRAKLIDLTTSLSLQMQQAERAKAEKLRLKEEGLMALMRAQQDDSDSDGTPEFNQSDYSAVEEEEVDDFESSGDEAQPGPSQRKVREPRKATNELKRKIDSDLELEAEAAKIKKELEPPNKDIQSTSGMVKPQKDPETPEEKFHTTSSIVQKKEESEVAKNENEIESTAGSSEYKEEFLEPKEE